MQSQERAFSNMNLEMFHVVIFSCERLAAVLHSAGEGPYSRVNGLVTAEVLLSLKRLITI